MRLPLTLLKMLFNRTTLWAVILVLIVFAVMISTTDTSPTWIYQGF
ncbi:MAG: hypothetical protein GYA15_06215 [Leptolinea sp.]|jgi:hypothetical protein|nr:hypothetical protein [Leptolinea sp.]